MAHSTPQPELPRLAVLDILRALALLGIVIVHTHDRFNIYAPLPEVSGWVAEANGVADWIYGELFLSKSFLLFSFLFGVSFFIQLDRSDKRGVDFRMRFLWRLALLFLFGLVHTLFYNGDILTIFAILGIFLVPLYKRSNTLLVCLITLFLLQPIALSDWLHRLGLFDSWIHSSAWFRSDSPAVGPSGEYLFMHGSWSDVARWNLTTGQVGKWQFFITSGRLFQTMELFIAGLLVGRLGVFQQIDTKRSFFRNLAVGALLVYLGTLAIKHGVLSTIDSSECRNDGLHLLGQWSNLAYFVFFSSLVTLIVSYLKPDSLAMLRSTGKCTLTCYCTQSTIFTALLFGWGLGLYNEMQPWLAFIGATLVFSIQALCCQLWTKHFRYGPLEWIWRVATHAGTAKKGTSFPR